MKVQYTKIGLMLSDPTLEEFAFMINIPKLVPQTNHWSHRIKLVKLHLLI